MKHHSLLHGLLALLSPLLAHEIGTEQNTPSTTVTSPPNIVVIISDDQGYHDYGFMGHPHIQTPHLDKLASQSLLYERGYVTTALCCPSLATMLTGQYPHQHGYTGNDPIARTSHRRLEWVDKFRKAPQLPALMEKAGYLSLHTGKYWQGDPKVSGFTHSMGATARHGSKESLGIGRNGLTPIYNFIAEATQQKKPFLVWYAPFMPHTPHTPPQRLFDKYKQIASTDPKTAKYYAMCDWLDETCGSLLGHLDEKKLTENTVIFYICDNGWPQGSAGYRGDKRSPWEQGTRTPIMIKWPRKIAPKRDTENLASNLDLPVTLLKIAGEPVPEAMSGIDLLDPASVNARDTLYFEDFAHDMLAPDEPEATIEARAIISKYHKYVETYERIGKSGPPTKTNTFLFDLKADPKEQHNIITTQPDKGDRLKNKLNAWWNPLRP